MVWFLETINDIFILKMVIIVFVRESDFEGLNLRKKLLDEIKLEFLRMWYFILI